MVCTSQLNWNDSCENQQRWVPSVERKPFLCFHYLHWSLPNFCWTFHASQVRSICSCSDPQHQMLLPFPMAKSPAKPSCAKTNFLRETCRIFEQNGCVNRSIPQWPLQTFLGGCHESLLNLTCELVDVRERCHVKDSTVLYVLTENIVGDNEKCCNVSVSNSVHPCTEMVFLG